MQQFSSLTELAEVHVAEALGPWLATTQNSAEAYPFMATMGVQGRALSFGAVSCSPLDP